MATPATSRSSEAAAFEQEYPGAAWLASSASLELVVVSRKIEALVARIARGYGLSHAALNTLAVIESAGGPIAVGEISARIHITTGTMTSVLDTLERSDYVRRLSDPHDRRRVLIDITAAAQSVLDKMLPEVQQLNKAIMGALDDKTLRALLDTLAAVTSSIENVPDTLPTPGRRRKPARLRRTEAK